MTELEEKLLHALTALSRQYEEEQRRQSRHIATLSQQVNSLRTELAAMQTSAQRLTEAYRDIARTLNNS